MNPSTIDFPVSIGDTVAYKGHKGTVTALFATESGNQRSEVEWFNEVGSLVNVWCDVSLLKEYIEPETAKAATTEGAEGQAEPAETPAA